MYTSRITLPNISEPEPEDIFSTGLYSLFTDDTPNSHGTPGSSIIYRSPRFGELSLRIPAHPDVEDGRKLFAHYLWNAAVIVADGIEVASYPSEDVSDQHRQLWHPKYWDMRDKNTLELGAGTALPSIISALSGAKSITITDHPSSPALTTGAIERNILANLFESTASPDNTSTPPPPSNKPKSTNPSEPKTNTSISTHGYLWGETHMSSTPSNNLPNPDPTHQPSPNSFDRIIIADCLWMPHQHVNLVKTILHFLSYSPTITHSPTFSSQIHKDSPSNTSQPCAIVVAGFHTGRSIVAQFFDIATGSRSAVEPSLESSSSTDIIPTDSDGVATTSQTSEESTSQSQDLEVVAVQGRLKAAEIFEIDVDGNTRPWRDVRDGEDKFMAKRWCVCAVLVRR